MSEANVELVRRGFAAMAGGDLEAIGELLDPDVRWHAGDPDSNYACHNRREALAYMQRPGRGPLGELVDVIDFGDRVVVVTQPPPDPNGTLPPRRANVTTIREGRVVEMVGFESPEAALEHVTSSSG